MQRQRIDELIAVYRDGLLNDTLPFWIRHCGGPRVRRVHCVPRPRRNRDRYRQGCLAAGPHGWLLGELYNNVDRREEWLELAQHGIDFIERHCFDPADGRMWFHVTREGRPIRKRRYAFSESFAAIAYGELAKATGDERYADKAGELFQRFIDHNLAPQGVDAEVHRHAADTRHRLSHDHDQYRTGAARIDRAGPTPIDGSIASIDTIRRYHMKDDLQCVMETVGPAGEIIDHFDGRTLNPGHAIEGAWFILREGRVPRR